MQSQAMKLQHLPTSFKKDHSTDSSSSSSLTIRFKRARPTTKTSVASLDPKTFSCTQLHNQDISPSGGTRWNPTQEQIRFLEGLYAGGMRTPNAEQIERITEELGKYGRIEGKNVFYWFQNHKARERQRQKRSASMLVLRAASPPDPIMSLFSTYKGEKEAKEPSDGIVCKRKYIELEEDSAGDRTLELFPLHPEGGRGR